MIDLAALLNQSQRNRGYRKQYVPGWNSKCSELYENYVESDNVDYGRELLEELNSCRKKKRIGNIQEMDFKHSSRKAWSLLKKWVL